MGTYSMKAKEVRKDWVVIDAENLVLGRLAAFISPLLRGKHKVGYTPHMDCGDHVVVVNAEKVCLTGDKLFQKKFFWHTGYPGGIKEKRLGQILSGQSPERVVRKAVERMIVRSPLGRQQMRHLKVYKGPTHPHAAQSPKVIDVASLNPKNRRKA